MKTTDGGISILLLPLLAASLWAGDIHDAVVGGDLNTVKALLEGDPTLLGPGGSDGNAPFIRVGFMPRSGL